MVRAEPPTLSVIIPCFNERARLRKTLDEVAAWARAHNRSTEIIVADDGSSDGTADLARTWTDDIPGLRVVALPHNEGKGAAVRAGLLAAQAPLRAFIDADGATPFEEIASLEKAISNGAAVAVGSRVLDQSNVRALFHRRFFGFFFRALVRTLLVRAVDDTQCGFKLFRADVVPLLFGQQVVHGFAFDVEVIGRAERAGLHVVEIAVRWREQSGSKVRVLRDGLKMALDVVRLRSVLGPLASPATARRPR